MAVLRGVIVLGIALGAEDRHAHRGGVALCVPMRLVEVVYALLPAYVANMAAPFARFWPGWNRPISRQWLGDHKTVVGFLLGVVAAILTSYVQSRSSWSPPGLEPPNWLVLGCAQGVGAMTGDAVKSFFKRRIGIGPGGRWIPADQLDFIIGAMVLGLPWLALTALDVMLVLGFTFVAHIIVNHAAFRLRIRDTKMVGRDGDDEPSPTADAVLFAA
jgi:CDP-2,3-bis-(O-geranylgeranyl)-sn-glycerol synthase